MSLEELNKIKSLLNAKGNVTERPTNGVESIAITEERVGSQFNYSVAVGVIANPTPRFFTVSGKVYDNTFNQYQDSSLQIEPKDYERKRNANFVIAEFHGVDLMRKIAEASWAEKFNDLKDLVAVLEEL